jgi:hypothetical protein
MTSDVFDWDERLLDDGYRREYLLRMMAAGALGLLSPRMAGASWFSSESEKLANDRSIHSLRGSALVNGEAADLETRIYAGDRVDTRAESEIVFAVGGDSFLLRSNSHMEIDGANLLVRGLRLLSGGLLSVFAPRQAGESLRLAAPTATVGVRGTGVYLEAEPGLTYVCTCYGSIALASNAEPDDAELIATTSHDMPRYVSDQPVKGTRIRPAPMINHSSEELKLLEAIVGRNVPKGFGTKGYTK